MKVKVPAIHAALVDRLVADARPVQPLRSRRLLLAWIVLQAAVLAALVVHGLRPDIGTMLHRPLFVAQVLALITSGTLAAWLAARGAFPDRAAALRSIAAVVVLAISGLIPLVTGTLGSLDSFVAMGLPCLAMTIMVAAAPLGGFLLLIGGGASVMPARAGLLAGAAAFLLAAAGMRAVCSLDDPLHLLVWHALPVVWGGAVAALLGGIFLGRWAVSRSVTSGL